MLSRIKSILQALDKTPPDKGATPYPGAVASSARVPTALNPKVLVYPITDPGIAVQPPQELLATQSALIKRLKLHAAVTPEVFSERFEQVLLRLAQTIGPIPATAAGLFATEGGLFRVALEVAYFSYQASDGRIFTGSETVERRHSLEVRWRYLCFVCGLLYPLGASLDNISISNSAGQVWPRHQCGLLDWVEKTQLDRIYVGWASQPKESDRPGPSTSVTALIAFIVGPQNMQWLADGSLELTKALYDIASGGASTSTIARETIEHMFVKVCHREEATRPQAFGKVVSGTHVGPYLIGAIRALLDSGRWRLNDDNIKADANGLYLVWPQSAADIIEHGKARQQTGWPDNSAVLAQMLRDAGIVVHGQDDLGMVEVITNVGEIVNGYKLKNPLAILENFDPDQFLSPKALDAVLKSDPLMPKFDRAMEPKVDAQPVAHPVGPTESSSPSLATAASAAPLAEQSVVQAPAALAPQSLEPEGGQIGPGLTDATATCLPGPESLGRVLRESEAVKFSDLVAEDVKATIRGSLNVELLGKVIKAWREREPGSRHMRMTDNGAAISLEFLAQNVRDVAAWSAAMAEAGLIYTPKETPGLKVQKVQIPEGGKPREAVVLARLAVKKLGLS